MSGLGLKLALALAGVLGLILLLQRASRRWGGAFGAGRGADSIRLVGQRTLGPRISLALVEVMDRTLLLGVSSQGVRHLADLGPAAPSAAPPAAPPPALAPPEPAPEPEEENPEFEIELTRRLAALHERYLSVEELGSEGGV
jgi:flagellar biosynthetic protein FliO